MQGTRMMRDDIEREVEAWMQALPGDKVASEVHALVARIWAMYGCLPCRESRDTNRARKLKARRDELSNFLATLRRNNPAMALEQEAYRDKCRQAGLYGLYMPVIDKRRLSTFQAIWQLADGSYLTTKPVSDFKALYESLSLPRVPIAFDLDEACLLTVF